MVQQGVDARTGAHVGPGRPAVPVDRPGRAAGQARGDRPGRARLRPLARPDPAGPGGGAGRLRHPGRPGAGPAGAARLLDQARDQRDQRARPGHRASGPAPCRCPAWARSAASASGRKAATRPGSATPTTPRRRWCCATTRAPARRRRGRAPPGTVDVPEVTTRQVAYASQDGTEVRMLVICRRARPGSGRRAAADDPVRVRRVRHQHAARLRRLDPGLGRARGRLRDRRRCAAAARRARSGTGPACATASRTCSTTSTPPPRS